MSLLGGIPGWKGPGWGWTGWSWSPGRRVVSVWLLTGLPSLPNSISQLQIWDHVTKSRNNTAAVTIVDAAHETQDPHPATEQGGFNKSWLYHAVPNRRLEKSRSLA